MIFSLRAFNKAKKRALVVSVLFLTACTSMPVLDDKHKYAQLAPFHTLQNIPYFPQIEDQCGPSSLATMLVMQGIDITPEQLRGKIYIPGKKGAVTTEIVARARRYGLLAYVLEPTLVNVLAEINAGNPVLVMQNLAFDWIPMWHFSVAMGYDLTKQTISLRSGNEVEHQVSFDLFNKTWRRAESWAMVITAADQIPATATETRLVQAVSELEQVGDISAASVAYKTMLARWPNNSIAKFGAGNAAYALGRYQEAEQFFLSYLELQPAASEGWNNLAYSFLKRGCITQAKKAISCAVKIEPDNKLLFESYHEINGVQQGDSKAICQLTDCPAG